MEDIKIINFYLERCEKYSSPGGYTSLSYNFSNIKKETLNHFSGNGAKGIVGICDKITQEHLDVLSKKTRLFDWSFCEGDLLREKIKNTLL